MSRSLSAMISSTNLATLSELSNNLISLKLPSININKIQTHYSLSVTEYWNKIENHIAELFKKHTTEYSEIQSHIESLGLIYLGSKEIKFQCNCSRERMVNGLWSIVRSSGVDHLFGEDENEIEAKCDYCKTSYLILKKEFIN